MNPEILVAALSGGVSVLVAAMTYFFTKKRERDSEWRKKKLEYYSELIAAVSGIVEGDETSEAHQRFATACNTIGLVASQEVIKSLTQFRLAIQIPPDPPDAHERKFIALLLAIRRDLDLELTDDAEAFRYILLPSGVGAPKPGHGAS